MVREYNMQYQEKGKKMEEQIKHLKAENQQLIVKVKELE